MEENVAGLGMNGIITTSVGQTEERPEGVSIRQSPQSDTIEDIIPTRQLRLRRSRPSARRARGGSWRVLKARRACWARRACRARRGRGGRTKVRGRRGAKSRDGVRGEEKCGDEIAIISRHLATAGYSGRLVIGTGDPSSINVHSDVRLSGGELPRKTSSFTTAPQDRFDRLDLSDNHGLLYGDQHSRIETMDDLESVIQITRQEIDTSSENQSDQAQLLNSLGTQLRDRCLKAVIVDLEETTQKVQVIDATPENRLNQTGRSKPLSEDRYLRTQAIADLQEAIRKARKTVNTPLTENSDRESWLYHLGVLYGDRYCSTQTIADLEEIMEITNQMMLTEKHYETSRLANLKVLFGNQYSKTRTIVNLEEAVQTAQRVIDIVAEDHLEPMNSLRFQIWDEFQRKGTVVALQKSLQVPHNSEVRFKYQYSKPETVADLEKPIQMTRQALDIAPEDLSNRANLLTKLAVLLHDRFGFTGMMIDLEEAIRIEEQAIDILSEDHSDRILWLSNLGVLYAERFDLTGAAADLEKAIQIIQQVVDTVSEHDPSRTRLLNNLARLYGTQVTSFGETLNLEKAIRMVRQTLEVISDGDFYRTELFETLGNLLTTRFEKNECLSDLKEFIPTVQTYRATPKDHWSQQALLDKLEGYLREEYSKVEAKSDLDEAIRLSNQVVDATPAHDPLLASRLHLLASRCWYRYSRTYRIIELEKIVQSARKAVNADDAQLHVNQADYSYNTRARQKNQYSIVKAMADRMEAAQLTRQALDAASQNHPDRAAMLNSLGTQLGNEYTRVGASNNLKEAVLCHQSALHQPGSPTLDRILGGQEVLKLCATTLDWQRACRSSSIAVHLIPKLSSRSLENSDKQHLLGQVVGLACDATAAALHAGKAPLFAVSLLEEGRGILASSLNEIRTSMFDLQKKYPELTERFICLRNELETPVRRRTISTGTFQNSSLEIPEDRRYQVGKELDKLIVEIRNQPGFEKFLFPLDKIKMHAAAERGPVVVINVSDHRCDALLVEKFRLRSLALPDLKSKEIKERAKKAQGGFLGHPETLEWLWDAIANPILDGLGFVQTPSDDNWPHVWWISTGLLSRFPLHAAGYHSNGSTQTVLDRVMSSYSSSIRAIANGRSRNIPESVESDHPQALLVAMQDTPGSSQLLSATGEIAIVHRLCKSMAMDPIEPGRHKQDIVSHLPNCRIFHFAGHGHSDELDPSQSHLLVKDWKTNRLTVADLLDLNLNERPPFLAYLSACETGQIHDERFLDESIHLINAIQLAGFRHVIGTLWEIDDDLSQDMARLTYEGMRDKGMTDESVCWGLHKATRELRDRCMNVAYGAKDASISTRQAREEHKEDAIGVEDGNQRDTRMPWKIRQSTSKNRMHWVPYVHFGV